MEYAFIGGSMGVVVGEKSRAPSKWPSTVEAGHHRLLLGGARMMEGALSLMQMAKVVGRARAGSIASACRSSRCSRIRHRRRHRELRDARRPEHRRTEALDRFRRTARHRTDDSSELPEGFHAVSSCSSTGWLDLIVDRRELKATIARALRFMGTDCRLRSRLRRGHHHSSRRADLGGDLYLIPDT
jgi:acetyl-CoA carboxylase carboxyl transferase subunit beta